jgi:hypothetical protein
MIRVRDRLLWFLQLGTWRPELRASRRRSGRALSTRMRWRCGARRTIERSPPARGDSRAIAGPGDVIVGNTARSPGGGCDDDRLVTNERRRRAPTNRGSGEELLPGEIGLQCGVPPQRREEQNQCERPLWPVRVVRSCPRARRTMVPGECDRVGSSPPRAIRPPAAERVVLGHRAPLPTAAHRSTPQVPERRTRSLDRHSVVLPSTRTDSDRSPTRGSPSPPTLRICSVGPSPRDPGPLEQS